MAKIILAEIDFDGNVITKTYTRWEDLWADTGCPDYHVLWLTSFKVSGRTYAERKACAERIGIECSHAMGTWYPSWLELYEVTDVLTKIAKRYGLVEDFRENGLI